MDNIIIKVALIATILSPQAYSKCDGESGYTFTNFRNRNPQVGGFVSNNAYVDDSSTNIFIGPNVSVCGSSNISGNAKLYGEVIIDGAKISGNAEISENAHISNAAEVTDNAKIKGKAKVSGSVNIYDNAVIAGNAKVFNTSEDYLVEIYGNARITGNAQISQNSLVSARSRVQGNTILKGDVEVTGRSILKGFVRLDSGVHDSVRRDDKEPQNEIDARNKIILNKKLRYERAKNQSELNIQQLKKDLDHQKESYIDAYNTIQQLVKMDSKTIDLSHKTDWAKSVGLVKKREVIFKKRRWDCEFDAKVVERKLQTRFNDRKRYLEQHTVTFVLPKSISGAYTEKVTSRDGEIMLYKAGGDTKLPVLEIEVNYYNNGSVNERTRDYDMDIKMITDKTNQKLFDSSFSTLSNYCKNRRAYYIARKLHMAKFKNE